MLPKLKLLPFLFMMIILSLGRASQVEAQDDMPPLDIILLLDSSGSTVYQPELRELIEKATEFLLDYLEANAEFAGLDYRLGVVGFNHGVIEDSAIPLGRPSEANLTKFFTDTHANGDTDFKPVLNYALDEFIRLKTLETGRVPIVILMTDGQPARQRQPLSDLELNTYFDELGQTLTTAANNIGVQFYVVAVGDAAADQARWQNALPTQEQYVYIDDSSNLSEVYWQFLSEFMGGEQDAITELTANQTYIFSVEPYLDEISLTVLTDTPVTDTQITSPRNYRFTDAPVRGGEPTDLHAIYSISTPEAGDWQMTLQGANGRLLITRRYPQVILEVDQSVLPVSRPFTVRAILNSASLAILNPETITLRLINNQSNPECYSSGYPFTRLSDGSYETEFPGFTEADIYALSPMVCVGGQAIEIIKEEIEVKAVHLPEISSFNVTPGEYGKPFTITYDITYDEGVETLIPELQIFIEDELLKTVEVDAHNTLAENTLEYLPEQEGNYEFVLRIQGITPDQLNYADEQSKVRSYSAPVSPPITEQTPITPTPVETVTVEPTETAEPHEPLAFPDLSWLLWAALFVVTGIAVVILISKWLRNQESSASNWKSPLVDPDGENDFTEKIEQLEERSRQEGTTPAVLFKQIKEVSQYPVDTEKQKEVQQTLGTVIKNYSSHSPQDFYKLIADLLNNEARNAVVLKPLVEGLDSIWDQDFENSLKNVYQYLLHNGEVSLQRLETLSHEYHAKSRLAGLLKKITEAQNKASYERLSHVHGNPEWFQALYMLLNQLNSQNAELVLLDRECFRILQTNDKPNIIGELADMVYPVSVYIPNKESSTREEWDAFYNILIDVAKDIEVSKIKITEATFIAKGLRRQAQLVKLYSNEIFDQRQSAVMIYGDLDIEYRVSFSFYDPLEESVKGQDWIINLLVVIYHYDGADITDLMIKTRERTRGGSSATNKNDEGVSQLIELPESYTRVRKNQYLALHVQRSPVMETEVTHLFQYKSKRLRGAGIEEMTWPGENNFGQKGRAITLHPRKQSAMEKSNPFVFGRPIIPEEFAQGIIATISYREKARQIADYIRLPGTRLIFVQGLRQSGKTTTLLQVLKLLKDESRETPYLLMNLFLKIHDDEPRFMFALDLLRCFCEELKPYESLHEKARALLEKRQSGEEDDTFYTSLGELFDEVAAQEIKIALVIQEADRFELLREKQQGLLDSVMEMLALLMAKGKMTVIAECDNIESQWEVTLQKKYQARFEGRPLDEKGIHSFTIMFVDFAKVSALLDFSPVPFTDLAKIAIWNFSGGYLSLVQMVASALIQEWESDKRQKIFTVDDVKRVIKELAQSDANTPLLDYVQVGFMAEEKELMHLLVSERFIDNKTGILQGVYLKDEWYGDGIRALQNRAQERGFVTLANQMTIFLQRLNQKGVLEPVVINGKYLSLVRWRIGWLVEYWRNRTLLNPVKELQQN